MYCMMSEWIPLKERSKMVTLIWAGKDREENIFLWIHSWFAKIIFPWKQERSLDLRNKFITYIAEEENCILFQDNQDNEKHDKMQKK